MEDEFEEEEELSPHQARTVNFIKLVNRAISCATQEWDMSYVEIVGALECIKFDILSEQDEEGD